MTLTLTPEPSTGPNDPPRVRADLVAPDGGTFTALQIRRGASLIRRQPFVGATSSVGFDYEAPFGVPVTYTATGSYLPVSAPDWTETWPDLSEWSGDTGDWATAGGEASSSVADAAISRDASGTIQRVTVADPVLVRVELVNGADAVVCSLQVDASKVTLTGTSPAQATGGGSFSLLLSDGTVTASADDSSWSLSREYTGTPVKVRLVALEGSYGAVSSWPIADYPSGIWVDATGNVFTTDQVNNLVHKFDNSGTQVGSWSTPGIPYGIWGDTSGNIFVTDYDNKLVRKFNSSGSQTASWSTTGVAFDIWGDTSGNIFVIDFENRLVRKFNSSGTQTASWSTTDYPSGVWGDVTGSLYVLSRSSKRVRKFNSSGTQTASWSTIGTPEGISGDASGNVYVSDSTSLLVRKFDSSGIQSTSWPTGGPVGVVVCQDSTGDVLTAGLVGGAPSIVTYAVTVIATIGTVEVTPVTTPQSYSSTATTTLAETRAWLIHPSQPSLSVGIDEKRWNQTGSNVSIESAQQTTHAQEVSVFSPPGRSRSVVYPLGPRKAGEWTLVLNAPILAVRDAILSLLADGAPLLLRSPGWDWDLPDGWYAVGDVTQTRTAAPLQQPYRELTLPLTPVDSPPVALVPEWTYGDLLLAAPTYGDVLSMFPTYLDVLTGSGS